jgi:DNA-binding transcriptional MerR regulator
MAGNRSYCGVAVQREAVYGIAELAEEAGVPENTARRYVRLFDEFFGARQFGRTRRYPREAAALLAQIAGFYRQGLGTEEVFARLHGEVGRHLEGAVVAAGGEIGPSLGERCEVLARDQALVRSTVAILWREYKRWRAVPGGYEALGAGLEDVRRELAEARVAQAGAEERLGELAAEVQALRREKAELELRFERRLDELADVVGPSDEFLSLPLVFKSEKGEFLGVSDKARKHFSLKDFLGLIEARGVSERSLSLSWKRGAKGGWQLGLREYPGQPERERRHVIELKARRTPKGNQVACLERLHFGGQDMPVFFFYELFKQFGKGLAGEGGR